METTPGTSASHGTQLLRCVDEPSLDRCVHVDRSKECPADTGEWLIGHSVDWICLLEHILLYYDGTPHNTLLVLPRHRMGVPSELDEARSGVPLAPGYFYHSS